MKKGPTGKRNDFEAAVSYLLPKDPVVKRKEAPKRGIAHISDTTADPESKDGIGKSGVHLRWHSLESYSELNTEQKEELYEWRLKNGKKGTKKTNNSPSGKDSD